MEKTATLNLRVNPTVYKNAELMSNNELHAVLKAGYDDIAVYKVHMPYQHLYTKLLFL